MEINSEATCGDCPFYNHQEDADFVDDNPTRPISFAWGHCQRFPKWERKTPTTPACGEHPQYFLELGESEVLFRWANSITGKEILTEEEFDEAREADILIYAPAGGVVPIDGETEELVPGWIDTVTGNDIKTADALYVAQKAGTAIFGGPGKIIPIDDPIS